MKYGKIKKYYYENYKFHELYEIIEDLGFKSTTENLTDEMKSKGYTALFKNENDGKFYIFWSRKTDGILYEIGMKEVLV